MKNLTKIFLLALAALTISACGKMGELESVKPEEVVLSKNAEAALDQQTTQQVAIAPEMEIMPHNSK